MESAMKCLRPLVAVALLLCLSWGGALAAPNDNPLVSPRTQWFRDARFGMFVHWGLYSVAAGAWQGRDVPGYGEWIMSRGKIPRDEYAKLAGKFNPVKFDADAWVKVARDAGMRYLVITAKHHDGFCLFGTGTTTYDIVDGTPYGRDVMKELSRACREQGLKFCFYYSIMDWHNPDQTGNFPAYHSYLQEQVKELLSNYGPLGIMWFDGEWIKQWDQQKGRELEALCRSLQPQIIVNNRVGKRKRDDGDYETPEQTIPAGKIKGRLWETCMTMNGTWGYKSKDHNWKSATDCLHKLVDIASKGGNFLLNVGPTDEGEIPAPSVSTLREMGAWLRVNGEAVYGTDASPYTKHPFDGRCTTRGNTLYVHLFAAKPNEPVLLRGLSAEVRGARLLDTRTDAAKVTATPSPDGPILQLTAVPDGIVTVVALELAAPPTVDTRLRPGPDGVLHLPARSALTHGDRLAYEDGNGKDNLGFWTVKDDWAEWSVVAPPGEYEVLLDYACDTGSGGSRYAVEVGEQRLEAMVPADGTGSWTAFRQVALGRVQLPGEGTIAIRALTKPNLAVMNVRSMKLVPKAE
jgi:alpha-L-fucosidase